MILESERLRLRRLDAGDAAFVLALLNEPAFLRNIGDRGVRTLQGAREYIAAGPVASYARHGFGMYLALLRDGGAPVGLAGLVKRSWLADVDVGFALMPAYRSQGLALESATAVMAHARRDCGLGRLAGIVSPGNQASIRVLEGLGMRRQGLVRAAPDAEELCLYARELVD